MKRLFSWVFAIIVISTATLWLRPTLLADLGLAVDESDLVVAAFRERNSNILVEVSGRVALEMPDVVDASSVVQQFLVILENNHRVMVSRDLDVAGRIPVAAGGQIRVKGEYDWTPDGGHIHWTHSDPTGNREGGWVMYQGRLYD